MADFLGRVSNPLVLILLFAAAVSAFTGDVASFVIIATIVPMSVDLDEVQQRDERRHRLRQQAAFRQALAGTKSRSMSRPRTRPAPSSSRRRRPGADDRSSVNLHRRGARHRPGMAEEREAGAAAQGTRSIRRSWSSRRAVQGAVGTGRKARTGLIAAMLQSSRSLPLLWHPSFNYYCPGD